MAEGEPVLNVEAQDTENVDVEEKNPKVEQTEETVISESNPEAEQSKSGDLKPDTEMSDSKPEEIKTETEAESKSTSSSPTSYRIPKLSEKTDDTKEDTAEVAEEEEGIKLTVDEEHSDTELLVDETMEVQSEINNESDKDKDAEDVNENGKNEEKEKGKRSSRSRKRTRSRSTSRSRSREKRRLERFRDIKDTSSDNPEMVRSRVFVGHLDTDNITKDDVQRLFSPYGRVIGVALHKGYGFVQYDNADSATAAIKEAHGTPVGSMKIGEIILIDYQEDYHHRRWCMVCVVLC